MAGPIDVALQTLNPTGKTLQIDSKSIELFFNEAQRMIVMRIVNMKTGAVECLIGMDPDTAAKHTRDMFNVCNKIKAYGTHLILPGDPGFKPNG